MTDHPMDILTETEPGRPSAHPAMSPDPDLKKRPESKPDTPETPEVPEVPEESDMQEYRNTSETPEMPEESDMQEYRNTSETPEMPEESDMQGDRNTPEAPEMPEDAEATGGPETPDAQELTEDAAVPKKRKKRQPVVIPPMPLWGRILCALYWAGTAGFLLSQTNVVLGTLTFGEKEVAGGHWVLCGLWAAVLFSAVLSLAVLRPSRLRHALRKKRRKKRRLRWYHIPLMLLLDVYVFLIIEYVNNEKFLEMEWYYMLLNVAGILIIHILVLLLLNSLKISMMVILTVWSVFAVAFYLVYSFRGEPLQLIDILSVGTALQVAGNYKPVITRAIVTDVVGLLCLAPLIVQGRDACLAKKRVGKVLIRVILIALLIGGRYFYLNVGWNGGVGILTDLFAPIKTYRKYGTTVGFFCVAKYMRLTPPEGYSAGNTEAIAEAAAGEETPNTATDVKPVNIIAIMNESWADYRMVGNLQTNREIMPYYDSLKENTIKGHTLVCIRGGGTAKTEYEFLTGNSVKRFPGMVPYVSYFLHDQYSLVTTLEAQGYESAAMHPYKASNWKRPQAYRLLNFDHFYSEADFDEDVKRIRSFVSDQGNYETIVKMIEERDASDPPFFLFDITMQNHGGYKKKSFTGDITVEGYTNDEVNRYLSLMHETDKALEYLIEHFKQVEEPTLIVVFGDHYPTLPDEFTEKISGKKYEDLTLTEQMNYFATPFLIWANYDIPEAENVTTSVNYLGTLMLEQTGLEMPHYNYYLKDLMEEMPALNHLGYMDADGAYHSWKKADDFYKDLEWEYECLQYNELAEDRKRADWFFSLE